MDVRCPQCETLYELDERQTARRAVTLKCSRCQHVFRFEPGTSISQENQRRWMINSTRDGAVLYLTDFTDLHRWIMEKKVRRDDTISRTGEKWVKLGSVPEFAPIFIVVDSIADLTGSPEDSHIATRVKEGTPASVEVEENTAVETPTARTNDTSERPRVKTNVQFPNANAQRPTSRTPGPSAAPATPAAPAARQGAAPNAASSPASGPARAPQPTPGQLPPRPGGRPHTDTGERSAPRPKPSKPGPAESDPAWAIGDDDSAGPIADAPAAQPSTGSRAPLIIFLLLLVVGGGAATLWFTQPELVQQLLGTAMPDDSPVVALGETTVDEPDAAVAEPEVADPATSVDAALTAAFEAQRAREGELFDGAVFAIHQPLSMAIDMAATRAGKAAEGGLVDEQLASAKKALERGRVRQAKDLFEQVLEFEPRNADAVAGLGFVYLEQSNPERAASQFRRAIDLGGGDGSAYIGLGTAERQRGDAQAAYDAYDLYLGRYPRGEKASIARYQLQQLRKQLGM
jgi:predicted Zn finger-like uncharacterized protein